MLNLAATNFDTFVYRLIMSCRTLENIPGILQLTPAATCIRATRSCVSTWMARLAVEVQKPGSLAHLTYAIGFFHFFGYMKTLCTRLPWRQQDLVARIQEADGVILEFSVTIKRYRKYIAVGGDHIENLLQVNKMVFTDSIWIVSFTHVLAFVVQTAYVHLHISERLACKRSVFEHKFVSKI